MTPSAGLDAIHITLSLRHKANKSCTAIGQITDTIRPNQDCHDFNLSIKQTSLQAVLIRQGQLPRYSSPPLKPCSLRHHLEAGTVLQGRELPSVMAAACKALEGAMNIEATALGVAGLLEDLSI